MKKMIQVFGFFAAVTVLLGLMACPPTAMAEEVTLKELIRAAGEVEIGVDARARYEAWDGFERFGSEDSSSYDFTSYRFRPYLGYAWDNVRLFSKFQAAGGLDLPDNAISGPGLDYYNSSAPDDDPNETDIIELYLEAENVGVPGFGFRVGRQAIKDGAEVQYSDYAWNWLKENRLSERLIGNWDWSNMGRRYDAATVFYDTPDYNLNLFGAKALSGGYDYGGYNQLNDLFIGGGAFTVKKDTLPNMEFRLFDYFYRDDRDVISATGAIPGGKLEINTVGFSVLGVYPDVGAGDFDFMLWGSYQSGDWGKDDQEAYAAVAEAGYRLPSVVWQPWTRLGFAYASGDDDPGDDDNETFFNLLPSNHKYHGAMDTMAFSNLYDSYLQLILNPTRTLRVQLDGHYYMLAEDDEGGDYWYTGSGAYNDEVVGYERRSTGGDDEIGWELDLSAEYRLATNMGFTVGYAHFFGEDAAENYYLKEEDADWGYAQFDLRF